MSNYKKYKHKESGEEIKIPDLFENKHNLIDGQYYLISAKNLLVRWEENRRLIIDKEGKEMTFECAENIFNNN